MAKTNPEVEHALSLLKKGNNKSATKVFKKILKEDASEPIALEFFAVKEIKNKNFKNAIDLLKRALKSNNCRASALFQMGHALRDSGNILDSEKFYSQYFSISGDYKAAITYADILIKLSRFNKTIQILNQIELKYPKNIKILSLKSLAYEKINNDDLAIKLKKDIIQLNDISAEETLIKSGALLDLGLIDEGLKTSEHNLNCLYGEELISIINNYEYFEQPVIYGSMPNEAENGPLVLVSCDVNYYQKYFKKLIYSLKKNSKTTDIHVHLISKEEPNLSLFNLKNNSLTWEIDNCISNVKFSSRRYTLIPMFLKKLNRSIIVLDIDSLVKKDIEKAIKDLPEFDVAMYSRTNEIYINQKIAAGICIFSNSAKSIRIAESIASYILYFEEKKIDKWFIDQMALMVIQRLYYNHSDLNVINLPKYFLDWDIYRSESIIWTSKGDNKYLPFERV